MYTNVDLVWLLTSRQSIVILVVFNRITINNKISINVLVDVDIERSLIDFLVDDGRNIEDAWVIRRGAGDEGILEIIMEMIVTI